MASSGSSQRLTTPKLDYPLRESPDEIPIPLDDLVDTPVPFDQPVQHTISASAPDLTVSEPPQAPGPQHSTSVDSASSPLTSSDKLSDLPTSPSLVPRRFPTPSMRASHSQTQSFPSRGTPHNSPRASLRQLMSHDRGKNSSESGTARASVRRNSADSDRPSLSAAAKQGIRNVVSRLSHRSDPTAGVSPRIDLPAGEGGGRNGSRATSPLRFLGPLGFARGNREEPFIPEDPFRVETDIRRLRSILPCFPSRQPPDVEAKPETEQSSQGAPPCDEIVFPASARERLMRFLSSSRIFLADTTRVTYLYILLGLPAMYFGRVSRIFTEAEVSRPDIERMINAVQDSPTAEHYFYFETTPNMQATNNHIANGTLQTPVAPSANPGGTPLGPPATLPFSDDFTPPLVTPALARFKHSWETFIDTLTKEWKTMNLVSALLLSAQITIFQIPEAAYDPITRSFALLSLMCALMSLSYGCVYIVRFSTMRSMLRASRWAEEAQRHKTALFWNLWILLCLPALWLAWSMILFIISLLSFVWRTGAVNDTPADQMSALSPEAALAFRIVVTAVVVLGLFYFILIVRTLRHYGRNRVHRLERATGASAGGVWSRVETTRGRQPEKHSSTQPSDGPQTSEPAVGLGLMGVGRQASQRSPAGAGAPSQSQAPGRNSTTA